MGKICQSIGCILILYDESTGRTVNRNVCRIADKYGRDFIFKGNGIYVLLGEVHTETQIIIESNNYQRKQIFVSDDNMEPYYVWLMPNEKSLKDTCIAVKYKPYKEIEIILENPVLSYRLISNISKGEKCIELYHMKYDIIEGRNFRLVEGNKTEDIYISGKASDNRYILADKLKYSYSADKLRILPVIKIETDNTGEGMAVLKDVGENGSKCIIKADNIHQMVHLQYKQNTYVEMEGQNEK